MPVSSSIPKSLWTHCNLMGRTSPVSIWLTFNDRRRSSRLDDFPTSPEHFLKIYHKKHIIKIQVNHATKFWRSDCRDIYSKEKRLLTQHLVELLGTWLGEKFNLNLKESFMVVYHAQQLEKFRLCRHKLSNSMFVISFVLCLLQDHCEYCIKYMKVKLKFDP